jgi:hypothetical protein
VRAVLVYGPVHGVTSKSTTYSTACAFFPVSSNVTLFAEIILDVFDSDCRNCGMAHGDLASFGTRCGLCVWVVRQVDRCECGAL